MGACELARDIAHQSEVVSRRRSGALRTRIQERGDEATVQDVFERELGHVPPLEVERREAGRIDSRQRPARRLHEVAGQQVEQVAGELRAAVRERGGAQELEPGVQDRGEGGGVGARGTQQPPHAGASGAPGRRGEGSGSLSCTGAPVGGLIDSSARTFVTLSPVGDDTNRVIVR